MSLVVHKEDQHSWIVECGGCGVWLQVPKRVEVPREYFIPSPHDTIEKSITDYNNIKCAKCGALS